MFNSLLEGDGYRTIRRQFRYYLWEKHGKDFVDPDLVTEAFTETLLKCQERFLAGKIQDTSRPLNYFYRALYNTYLTLKNKEAKEEQKFRSLLDTDLKDQVEQPDLDESEETPEEFWEKLDILAIRWQIDPHSWAMLKYMMKTNCTYQEVADLMGWSETTAWLRIKKTKEQIRELWKQQS